MFGYIYETTNLINGKKYIGKHISSETENTYLGSGTLLLLAIKKYGRKNFSKIILEIVDSDHEYLCLRETEIISERDAVNDSMYYNIAEGGIGRGSWTEEAKAEMIKNLKAAWTEEKRAERAELTRTRHKERRKLNLPKQKWFHDPECFNSHGQFVPGDQPENWIEGMGPNAPDQRKWYHEPNSSNCKMFLPNTQPLGWIEGRGKFGIRPQQHNRYKWYHDPDSNQRRQFLIGAQPEHWFEGKGGIDVNFGKTWYYNPETSEQRRYIVGDQPTSWLKGRRKPSKIRALDTPKWSHDLNLPINKGPIEEPPETQSENKGDFGFRFRWSQVRTEDKPEA